MKFAHFISWLCLGLSFPSAALAYDVNILQPNYRCQSKEFIPDNTVNVLVLQDKVSGMNHVELARTTFAGLVRDYFQVAERVEKSGDENQPVVFTGTGIQLSIEQSTRSENHLLQGVLQTSDAVGDTHHEALVCEMLR